MAKADGAKQWQHKTGSYILNSSIAIADGTVYFLECRNAARFVAVERGGAHQERAWAWTVDPANESIAELEAAGVGFGRHDSSWSRS